MGCLLPRFLVYCFCVSNLQALYLPLHCRNAGFRLDQGFLYIFNHCFLGFYTVGKLLGINFCPLTQLPDPHSASAVPGKPFRLVHDIEQASNTASHSRALDRCSAMVHHRLSGSFSFVEEALIGNRIFFCPHSSCYI